MYDFLFVVIELFSLALTVDTLQGKTCQTRCFQERMGHFEPRFQGEWVDPGEYFLVSTKPDTFCYLTVQTAPCYVQSFWHNTGVWRTDGQTDRQTDGIAIASTALAMRALRRAVKTSGYQTAFGYSEDFLASLHTNCESCHIMAQFNRTHLQSTAVQLCNILWIEQWRIFRGGSRILKGVRFGRIRQARSV